MRVLLVDDSPVARFKFRSALEHWGHAVVPARDGAEAWEIMQRQGDSIDLVISDWMMPKMDGLELTRRIRSGGFSRYVYIMLCTSLHTKAKMLEGMEAGPDDFLVKSADFDELRVRLRACERLYEANRKLKDAYFRMRSDLIAASEMQKSLLPQSQADIEGVKIEWLFRPATELCGDIFNFFPLGEGKLGFYHLDVSGHGVPAAMLSVTLNRVLLPLPVETSPLWTLDAEKGRYDLVSPAGLLTKLNVQFQSRDDMYFTMLYGVLDIPSLKLFFGEGGNPLPVLQSRNGCRKIGAGGFPVGMFKPMDYSDELISLQPGDRLFFYSDGVTESAAPDGTLFGDDRLMAFLDSVRDRNLCDVLNSLDSALLDWRRRDAPDDDVSVLAFELGPEANELDRAK